MPVFSGKIHAAEGGEKNSWFSLVYLRDDIWSCPNRIVNGERRLWNLASLWQSDPQKSTFYNESSYIRGKWWFLKYQGVFTEAVNFLWINLWNAEMRGKREKCSIFLKMSERNCFCLRAKTENLDFERLRGLVRFFQNFPGKSSPRYVDSRALLFSRGKIRFYMNFWNFGVP